mgnify:CR=1 FL=1
MLRSMLSAYLFSDDGIFNFELLYNIKQFPNDSILQKLGIKNNDIDDIIKNSIRAQESFNNKNSVGFVKTHNMLFNFEKKYPFTNFDNSLGVIYIVRDPRNLVLSYARHLDISIEETVKFVTLGKGNKNDFMGNWAENFLSWKAFKNHNKYLLIKYEDLINKKKTTMIKILKFLNQLGMKSQLDIVKLNKAIKSTDFSKVKNLEENETFYEGVLDAKTGKRKTFFNLGPSNDWRRLLDDKIKIKLEKSFEKEMIELEYL